MNAPELVVLYADVDAEKWVERLIDRGVESRCLRPFVRQAARDTMRDARLSSNPTVVAQPFLGRPETRFLVLWDHEGSGKESQAPSAVEAHVVDVLLRAGVARSSVEAVAFDPELEICFEPVWQRVAQLLAAKGSHVASSVGFDASEPKRAFATICMAHKLRSNPRLFEQLAGGVSLPQLKSRGPMARIANRLVEWFGADAKPVE